MDRDTKDDVIVGVTCTLLVLLLWIGGIALVLYGG